MVDQDTPKPTAEAFKHQELIQFNDGRMVLGFRTKGDTIRWGAHKYADPEYSSVDTILVTTHNGRRFVLGRQIAIELPELNERDGKFGKDGQPVMAAKLEDIAHGGLPDIEIGKAWLLTGDQDFVKSVLLDYKVANLGYNGAQQIDMPNPMDSAREHLDRVAQDIGL